jgi:hypothetical protein
MESFFFSPKLDAELSSKDTRKAGFHYWENLAFSFSTIITVLGRPFNSVTYREGLSLLSV